MRILFFVLAISSLVTPFSHATTGLTTEQFVLSSAYGAPGSVLAASDGGIWFTEDTGAIGRMDTHGVVADHPINVPDPRFVALAAGLAGRLWFADIIASRAGMIEVGGQITSYILPTVGAVEPTIRGIVPTPDGALWYAQGNAVARFVPPARTGAVLLPRPYAMAGALGLGPNGTIWVAEDDFGSTDWFKKSTVQLEKIVTHWLVRLSPNTGRVAEFRLPSVGLNANVGEIVMGPDSNMWFDITLATPADHWIGRITPDGRLTRFPLPAGPWQPSHLLVGPTNCRCLLFKKEFEPTDGEHPQIIYRIALDGTVVAYPALALPHLSITAMALATDGHLWLDDNHLHELVRVTLPI